MIDEQDRLRPDLQVIADHIPEGAKVLDIGCGTGQLLGWLTRNKGVQGRGIEMNQEKVHQALASGVSVVQGDANADLSYYPNNGYDYVILSQTLQAMQEPKAVLDELLRIAEHAIVSVPNFGHWRNRLYLAFNGRMPVTKTLTYEWYDTPNIHFCTITDFVILCEEMGVAIEERVFINNYGTKIQFRGKGKWANLIGEQGVFLLSRRR